MKTKLEMAHDYAVAMLETPAQLTGMSDKDIAIAAFNLAEAMQAEADKRECKERTDVLLTKDKDGNCLHFHHEFGHKKCMDCGASLEEWQPDWSQAPSGYDWFVVGGRSGKGFFCLVEPEIVKDHYWFVGEDCLSVDKHNYTGDWRESLRKRPQ